MSESIKVLAAALLFGFALAGIAPYPNHHDLPVLAAGAAVFVLIALLLRRPDARRGWLQYGVATFVCHVVPFLWFWQGAMRYGWWYPPQPPLIQQVFPVDGEAAYDAGVSNLFLVLWFAVTVVFLIRWVARRRG